MKKLRYNLIIWRGCLYGLPLLALPIYNVASLQKWEMTPSYFCKMSFVSIVEEMVFRGIMLELLKKKNWRVRIFASSFCFSFFHFVNLFNGTSNTYVTMQVLMAFVVGTCFSAVAIQIGSFLPCIIVHILINISVGENLVYERGLWLCIFIYVIYGLFLCRKIALTKGKSHDALY